MYNSLKKSTIVLELSLLACIRASGEQLLSRKQIGADWQITCPETEVAIEIYCKILIDYIIELIKMSLQCST